MEFKIPMPWGHISGQSYGTWSGTPLLAIHDWTQNSGSWTLIGENLPKNIYFVTIDLPGHGQSSHLPSGAAYHRVDFAAIIKRIVDHQKWKKVNLIGNGVGGELAILFASAFTNLVDKLILIDALKPGSVDFSNRVIALAAAIDEQIDTDEKYKDEKDNLEHFTREEGLKKLISDSNETLTQETAKLLLDREVESVGEDMLKWRNDIRLLVPDTLTPSHDQALALVEGLKGISVLYIKNSETKLQLQDEEINLNQTAIGIYNRICPKFVTFEISNNESHHYKPFTRYKEIAQKIQEFLQI